MCKMINLVLHSGVMVEFVAEDDIKMQKCFISQVNRNTWLSCFTETQKYPEHKLSRGVSLLWLPLLLVYIHEGCLCWDLIGCCCRGGRPSTSGSSSPENETVQIRVESEAAVRQVFSGVVELRRDRKSKWRTKNHQRRQNKEQRGSKERLEVWTWNFRFVSVFACWIYSQVCPLILLRFVFWLFWGVIFAAGLSFSHNILNSIYVLVIFSSEFFM